MQVHFEFSEGQEWLSLCLRVEAVYLLRAGVWERETEFEVLFAAEEMIGKPSTWPPYLTKLWFKKHLDHWDMLKLFNFVLYNQKNGKSQKPRTLDQWYTMWLNVLIVK